jgi:beta-glucosidase
VTVDGVPAGESVTLAAGQRVALVVTVVAAGRGIIDLRAGVPVPADLQERAVAAAAAADVAIVVVGLDNEWETEGRDRESLDLPGTQDELVTAVLAANPRTVVVVNAGMPVTMPWADDVPAVVQLWYPGQEGGHALADVLTGRVDASGRLPMTIPYALSDSPAAGFYPGVDGRMPYGEGLSIGYRGYEANGVAPRFAFGHGLSYTTFAYGEPALDGRTLTVAVTNTGDRAGAEVVQLYVADEEASVPRPPKDLRGFAKVHLAAGERTTVSFTIDDRALAFWDAGESSWRVEPGRFRLLVGSASDAIRGEVVLDLP